jgi:hypothetical protein
LPGVAEDGVDAGLASDVGNAVEVFGEALLDRVQEAAHSDRPSLQGAVDDDIDRRAGRDVDPVVARRVGPALEQEGAAPGEVERLPPPS